MDCISFNIINDALAEPTETFQVTNPESGASGTITILEDPSDGKSKCTNDQHLALCVSAEKCIFASISKLSSINSQVLIFYACLLNIKACYPT